MTDWTIALLFALGAGGWIYNKLMRSTGNNRSNSLVGATGAAALLFIMLYIILNAVLPD